jgi:hypothetical protein
VTSSASFHEGVRRDPGCRAAEGHLGRVADPVGPPEHLERLLQGMPQA